MHGIHGMTGREVMIWIELVYELAGAVRPGLAPIGVEVIAKVPGNVRKRGKPGDGVANEAALVFAIGGGMGPAVVHVEDERDDHVALTGEAQRPLQLLPMRHVKAAEVETGVKRIFRLLRGPGSEEHRPVLPYHDRFAEKPVSAAGDCHAD